MEKLEYLIAEYQDWLAARGLPQMSADELLAEGILTSEQRDYVSKFLERWWRATWISN